MPVDLKSAATALSNDEILRYSRHLIMPEVGMEGQQKLKAARVLCIGTGGPWSSPAPYLASARRAWFATGALSRCRRRGHAWIGRLRRSGLHQSSAPDHSFHLGRRAQEA